MMTMKRLLCLVLAPLILIGCQSTEPRVSNAETDAAWPQESDRVPTPLLAVGDELEIVVHTAPDLNRTVTIEPDGTFQIPFSGPIPAAGRSLEDVRSHLHGALSSELRDPGVDVLLGANTRHQIFVGGAVNTPGLYDLPGLINPLQAIAMAGGLTEAGRSDQIFLLRRTPAGETSSALLDLTAAELSPNLAPWARLQRFDVIYATQETIIDPDLFVRQQIRDALPIAFFVFYEPADDDR